MKSIYLSATGRVFNDPVDVEVDEMADVTSDDLDHLYQTLAVYKRKLANDAEFVGLASRMQDSLARM